MNEFQSGFNSGTRKWSQEKMASFNYTCGYCGTYVSSEYGMPLIDIDYPGKETISRGAGIYICTNCHMPTFIYKDNGIQVPGNRFGSSVKNVPEKVNDVYEEARRCYSSNAFTGTVLLCRKLLMNVAVDLGASDNLKFIQYVDYLSDQHFVSIKSHDWVDQIRKYGNEATHEIEIKTRKDAETILKFSEMLLKMNYEYPAIVNNLDN